MFHPSSVSELLPGTAEGAASLCRGAVLALPGCSRARGGDFHIFRFQVGGQLLNTQAESSNATDQT